MKQFSLDKKHILVTGASSGIGRETCRILSEAGARLTITGRNKERLSETFDSLKANSSHRMIEADLLDPDQFKGLCDCCRDLDGIVHSAGILKPFPVKFISERHFEEIRIINYEAPALLTSSLLKNKRINTNASIVFISSISSKFAHKGGALYSGTKAALDAFSRTLAIEHASEGIRSNTINAAMVRTNIFNEASEIITSEMMEAHGTKYPLGFGEANDIANAVLFLLSPASRWITGTSLVMDGGLTAGA